MLTRVLNRAQLIIHGKSLLTCYVLFLRSTFSDIMDDPTDQLLQELLAQSKEAKQYEGLLPDWRWDTCRSVSWCEFCDSGNVHIRHRFMFDMLHSFAISRCHDIFNVSMWYCHHFCLNIANMEFDIQTTECCMFLFKHRYHNVGITPTQLAEAKKHSAKIQELNDIMASREQEWQAMGKLLKIDKMISGVYIHIGAVKKSHVVLIVMCFSCSTVSATGSGPEKNNLPVVPSNKSHIFLIIDIDDVLLVGQYLELGQVLGITTFQWNDDRQQFFNAWNTKCKVSCMEAAMLVYDHNKPAHLILQLGREQSKKLIAGCVQQAAKRTAMQAGFEAEPIQTPPPAQRKVPVPSPGITGNPTNPNTGMVRAKWLFTSHTVSYQRCQHEVVGCNMYIMNECWQTFRLYMSPEDTHDFHFATWRMIYSNVKRPL